MEHIWNFFVLSLLWWMINSNDVRYTLFGVRLAVYFIHLKTTQSIWYLFHSNNHNCMQTRIISVTLSIYSIPKWSSIEHRVDFSLIIINTNISLLLFRPSVSLLRPIIFLMRFVIFHFPWWTWRTVNGHQNHHQ